MLCLLKQAKELQRSGMHRMPEHAQHAWAHNFMLSLRGPRALSFAENGAAKEWNVALVTVAELLLKLPLMHPQQLRKKAKLRPSSSFTRRASSPSISYLKTRIRGARLLNAARILVLIELTKRLHQTYRQAYDKQAADWLLPQNTPGQTDLASLISETRDTIKNASEDCAKLLGSDALQRFNSIAGNIQFNGDILVHVEGLAGGVREGRLSEVPPTSGVTVGDQIYLNPSGWAFAKFYNFPDINKHFADVGATDQHQYALATIIHEFLHTTGKFKADSVVGLDGRINSKQSEKYQKEVLKKCFSKR